MERNQPIVFVPREIIKYGQFRTTSVVGYVVSQAYLKSETKRYLDNGETISEYEVEYSGYNQANKELNQMRTYSLSTGDFVKKNSVFDDYESCKEHANFLNKHLLRNNLRGVNVQDAIEIASSFSVLEKIIKHLENDYLQKDTSNSEPEQFSL